MAEVPAQRSGMQLVQHLGLKRSGHAKAVAARAETEESLQAKTRREGSAAAEGVSGPAPGVGACACAAAARGPNRIRGERRANRGREAGVQEAARLCGGTGGHERGSRAGRGEELEGRIWLGPDRQGSTCG